MPAPEWLSGRRSPGRRRLHQCRTAAVKRLDRPLGIAPFRRDPGVRFLDERMHLRKQRARGRTLALERIDPLQPAQYRACLVHRPNVAAACARVSAETVSEGIRSIPTVAPNPDRDLGDARAAIDRGDGRAALKSLDRARRGYAKAHDSEGLDHVLSMVALVDQSDERTRVGRENVAYAIKQNLRQESRRLATQRGEAWIDPYPDLQAPTEHTGLVLTRRVKVVIGIAVLVAVLLIAAVIVGIALIDVDRATVTLRLVNDTQQTVQVRGCDDQDCIAPWMNREVGPGLETDADVDTDAFVDLFKVEQPGPDLCLPVRVHDGYLLLNGGPGAIAVKVSDATACPGTTVLPVPAAQTPL
jgi:hypothetical protein